MKSEATNSPRTSAGISKSLLTPCRRLGLTRRRPTGTTPLTPQSSLTVSTPTPTPDRSGTPSELQSKEVSRIDSDVSTPVRCLPKLRRQTSKKLLSVIATTDYTSQEQTQNVIEDESVKLRDGKEGSDFIDAVHNKGDPIPTESTANEEASIAETPTIISEVVLPTRKNSSKQKTPKRLYKQKSTDLNLKRKCMAVLDTHVIHSKKAKTSTTKHNTKENNTSDSKNEILSTTGNELADVDDIPLSEVVAKKLNKSNDVNLVPNEKLLGSVTLDQNLDFCDKNLNTLSKNATNVNVKLETSSASSSNRELKNKPKENTKNQLKVINSDSEDDDFHCRKTILIRKSYPKVSLQKAKSTSSITQKDIDDIKVRIRMKQNALLAKSGDHNIEELTELIKKWRKGCQEALMELLEIMKRKLPEKRNMNTAELLKMLNIPAVLVDYNVDDDYFVSPQ